MGWMKDARQMAEREKTERGKLRGPDRFWLPKDKKVEIVMIDDQPCPVYEHNPKLEGDEKFPRNWFTCSDDPDAACCELLGRKKGRSAVWYYTIVDASEWTDRNNNLRRFEVKLFGAKYMTQEKLSAKRDEREEGIAGKVLMARRYAATQNSAGVGDEHEILRDVQPEALFDASSYLGVKLSKLWDEAESDPEKRTELGRLFQLRYDAEDQLVRRVVPLNYGEILKPPTSDELREILRSVHGGRGRGGGGDAGGASDDSGGYSEDIPF